MDMIEPENPPLQPDAARSMELLDLWAAGDGDALAELVRLHAPWLRRHVSRKMSVKMRKFDTSEDVVQSVLLNLLRGGPTFRPANVEQFRGLVARAVFNRLCELHDYCGRQARDPGREQSLPSQPSQFQVSIPSSADPGRQVSAREERDFVAMALNLIDPEDHRIIAWHDFEGVGFAEIGNRLTLSEEGARSRHRRALGKLKMQAQRLREGRLEDLMAELHDGPGS